MSTKQTTTTSGKYVPKAAPNGQTFLFDKQNYIWMFAGIGLLLIGFLMMSGGKSPDPNKFNYSEIYSFRRITLAPIIVMLGFAVEVYAIMKKPKETTDTSSDK